MKSSDDKPGSFLVVSTTGIGDLLMGTPALRVLRESFPGSRIDVLVNAKRRELVARNPHIDGVIGYRNNFLFRTGLFFRMLATRYDFVLVFHANEDLWQILRVVNYGICYNRQNYHDPALRVIPLVSLPRHSIGKRMALVEKAGGKASADYRYEYSVALEDQRWAGEELRRRGFSEKDRFLGIQLGAADRFKCWPVESFAEAARVLRSRHGVNIYLNASSAERALAEHFLALFGREGVWVGGEDSLSRSAALIRQCSVFITPDTGPMHLAIALGVPLIGLFCPTELEETGPLECDIAVAIRKPRTCRPCLNRGCVDNFCMKQITVEEVCAAADRILERGLPGGFRR
ncbi:MAG TPA: glycosyltransferase family 9 protein [Thermodesulfobacteriota bacterium]|nr:glycosyltransferase family 9 protein [Thermodesulfobacteriota bacterium]